MHSEESRKRISDSKKGKKRPSFSAEWRRNISLAALGRKHSEETKRKITESRIAEKNPVWKGDDVGYTGLHDWIKRRISKPTKCCCCQRETEILDLANKSGQYLRDLSDWEYLCRRCHMTKDGRLEKLLEFRKKYKAEDGY